MSLLEYLLIFIVIVLVLWLVSALVGRGADIEMIENYRDLCDKYELMIEKLRDEIQKCFAENKQLKHDLGQYKDAAYEWEKLCEGHVADKKKMRMAINSIKAECDHKDLQDVLKFTKSVDAYEKKKALQ